MTSMKTDSNFNVTRFAQYLSLDLLRCLRKSGLMALACGLAPAVALACAAWTFSMTEVTDWELSITFNDFMAGVISVLFFLVTPINCYGHLTDKKKGAAHLMLPASHTEKFTSMVLTSIVIIPAVFVTIYLSTDALCAMFFPARYEGSLAAGIAKDIKDTTLFSGFFLPCMVSSAGLAGAVLFKKSKSAKTFMTAALSFIAIVIITVTLETRTGIMDGIAASYGTIWYLFQLLCAICCLTYTYFKTKTIEL